MKITLDIFHDFPRHSSYIKERCSSNMGSFHSLLELNYIQDFDSKLNVDVTSKQMFDIN